MCIRERFYVMVNRTTSQKGDIMILGMLKKKYRWFKAIMVALLVFSVGASLLLVHAEDEGIEETSDSSEITPTLLRAPSTTEIYLDGVSGCLLYTSLDMNISYLRNRRVLLHFR